MIKEMESNNFLLRVLSNRIPNAFSKQLDNRFKENNIKLTRQQWNILAILLEKDGCTQTYLAEKTYRDNPGITRLLDNLEREDYIERRFNKLDRRQRLIYLTPKCREVMDKVLEIVDITINEVVKGIKKEDLKVILSGFQKIFDNIEKLQ